MHRLFTIILPSLLLNTTWLIQGIPFGTSECVRCVQMEPQCPNECSHDRSLCLMHPQTCHRCAWAECLSAEPCLPPSESDGEAEDESYNDESDGAGIPPIETGMCPRGMIRIALPHPSDPTQTLVKCGEGCPESDPRLLHHLPTIVLQKSRTSISNFPKCKKAADFIYQEALCGGNRPASFACSQECRQDCPPLVVPNKKVCADGKPASILQPRSCTDCPRWFCPEECTECPFAGIPELESVEACQCKERGQCVWMERTCFGCGHWACNANN